MHGFSVKKLRVDIVCRISENNSICDDKTKCKLFVIKLAFILILKHFFEKSIFQSESLKTDAFFQESLFYIIYLELGVLLIFDISLIFFFLTQKGVETTLNLKAVKNYF